MQATKIRQVSSATMGGDRWITTWRLSCFKNVDETYDERELALRVLYQLTFCAMASKDVMSELELSDSLQKYCSITEG